MDRTGAFGSVRSIRWATGSLLRRPRYGQRPGATGDRGGQTVDDALKLDDGEKGLDGLPDGRRAAGDLARLGD
jgi:hypothetical protein